jgi:hypothetical protein
MSQVSNAVKLPQSVELVEKTIKRKSINCQQSNLSVKNVSVKNRKQTHQTVQSEQLAQQAEKGSRIAISSAEEACEVIAG